MNEAYICDYLRTPIGRYGGALAALRTDDLAAAPLRALRQRHAFLDENLDDVLLGCANQAGEDNRNVARMALLLAGFPETIPGVTINRLCASGMDAVGAAARAIRAGEMEIAVAGGVESMSRAPYVMGKAETPFARSAKLYDTTLGWRFIHPEMERIYGVETMPETAENVAREFGVSREDQDAFALRTQQRARAAEESGRAAEERIAVEAPGGRGGPVRVERDEHARPDTTLEKLAALKPIVTADGTVTAGNASGINDGAAALLIASGPAVERFGLNPLARVAGIAAAGVAPRVMGIGPVPAVRKLLGRLSWELDSAGVIELNEAFACQVLACLRELGIADAAAQVNPNGGAIALGHPLGMSGARITGAAAREMARRGSRRALAAMCVGVGQGAAIALENP